MAFIVTTKDNYWISPNAVSIQLNALGNADRIQCSVAAGSTILCYVKGVTEGDGLEYDVGHKYKHWPLSISPTFFDTHTEKYLYVAIPRTAAAGTQAMFVFPSEKLDVYGCNEAGDQIGSTDRFYIFLQGIISTSGAEGLAERTWLQPPDWGWLDSNEQYSSGGDSTWWHYNPITDMVTFLKKIASAVFEILKADSAEIGTLNVTGDATISGTTYTDRLQSTQYTGDGMFDSGFILQYLSGKAKLVVDQIVCRGKFVVNEIEDRIWTYAGGNLIFSAAGSTIFYVEYLDASGTPLGYTYINSPWLLRKVPLLARVIAWSKRRQIQRQLTPEEKARVVKFRCYETSDDGTMQTRNWWHTGDIAYCQTLNRVKNKTVTTGGYSGALSNTVYARRVIGIGSKRIEMSDDKRIYDYVDLSLADCDPAYDDWPAAGDVIVQRGSFTDSDRQGISTIEVTGDERGYKVYDGISGWDMGGKKKAFIGYNARTGRALLEVFGDAYIGAMGTADPHDGETYIRFDAARRLLRIKAVIEASSTVGNTTETLAQYINGVMEPTVQEIDAGLASAKAQQEITDAQLESTAGYLMLWGGDAARAVSTLNSIKADGKVTAVEKVTIRNLHVMEESEYQRTLGKAAYYGIDTSLFQQSWAAGVAAMRKYSAATPAEIPVTADFDAMAAYMSAYTDMLTAIADAANTKIDNITDDGVITGGTEKSSLTTEYLKSCREYAKYMEQAEDYFGSQAASKTAAFKAAFVNMVRMLNNGAEPTQGMLDGTLYPAWISSYTGFDTDTVLADTPTRSSANYRAVWNTYYTELNALLEAITKEAKRLSGVAQTTADSALSKISDMASDSKLDPSEKQEVKKEFENAWHEMMDSTGILDKAKDSGGSWLIDYNTWIKPYQDALAAIGTYLNGGTAWTIPSTLNDTTMPSWIKSANMSATNTIAGDTWRSLWNSFYTRRAAVLTTLTEKAQATANGAKSTADSAVTRLNTWANDSYISPSEKYALDMQWTAEAKLYQSLRADAAKYSIDVSALDTAYQTASTAVAKYTASSPENIAVGSDYANIAAYYTAKKTVQDALATAVFNKADVAQNDVNALQYLKDAIAADPTTIIGGLILSSMLVLRDTQKNIQAGMNGIYSSGRSIAFWTGGPNVDHEASPSASPYAKVLFRMDGSGYVAGGNISWDVNGNPTIQGYALSTEIIKKTSGLINDSGFIDSNGSCAHAASADSVPWRGVKNTIVSGNEFNICDSAPNSNRMWFNYTGRQGSNLGSPITQYMFGNGQGGYSNVVLYAGDLSSTSDIRLKNVLSYLKLSSEDFAGLPVFRFRWKDGDGRVFVGTSAQEAQKVLPDAVSEDEDGHLSLSYGTTAFAAAITNAREVVRLKKEVSDLKTEVAELRRMIRELLNNK